MVLKLTGGDCLGRFSKLPIRPSIADGIAIHASSARVPAVKKVPWLGFSKHEVGSNDDMLVDSNATGLIPLKGTHSK